MLRARAPRRRGFSLADLLAALAVLVVCGGLLLASASGPRAAAERTQSQNNLRLLGMATVNCSDVYGGKLPPGLGNFFPGRELMTNNAYGPVLFHLLPFVEQDNLYKLTLGRVGEFMIYAPWQLREPPIIKTYLAPGDPAGAKGGARSSYLANALALPRHGSLFPASFQDGTSNTILYAEGYSDGVAFFAAGGGLYSRRVVRRWTEVPVWWPVPTGAMFQAGPPPEAADADLPQGFSRAGINVGMADGSVRLVAPTVSSTTFFAACTPAGNDTVGGDW
jgi:hypothetical protein